MRAGRRHENRCRRIGRRTATFCRFGTVASVAALFCSSGKGCADNSLWPVRIGGRCRSFISCPPPLPCPTRLLRPNCLPPADKKDRKSVVSGKSVSVRVDLGGRRLLKKKITIHI